MSDELPMDVLVAPVIPEEPAPEAAPNPAVPSYDLRSAIEAQTRAETLARMTPLDRSIELMPISDHKKAFLKANPDLVEPNMARLAAHHYQAGLAEGVADDSAAMDDYIRAGMAMERTILQKRAVEEVSRPSQIDWVSTERPEPMIRAPLPELPKARFTGYAAPVSRDAHGFSGRRASQGRGVTLTAEEREIARNSFGEISVGDGRRQGGKVDLTNAEKEYLYAQNKARLQRKRESGEYGPDSNDGLQGFGRDW